MDSYHAYQYYLAIKLHFTKESYNVFKSKGKLKVTYNSFLKRNDKGLFEGLAYKFSSEKEYIQYMASNFMYGHSNVLYDPYEMGLTYYKEFIRRKQSITRIFNDDLLKLENKLNPYTDHYGIFNEYLTGNITLESIAILDTLENICDNVHNALVEEQTLLIKKSFGFVKFDKSKIVRSYIEFLKEIRENG